MYWAKALKTFRISFVYDSVCGLLKTLAVSNFRDPAQKAQPNQVKTHLKHFRCT